MVTVQKKIMELVNGEVFGEDLICFNMPNSYSIKVESISLATLYIEKPDFGLKYKRIMQPLQGYFINRQNLITDIIEDY
jgi:hypothetical protein